MRTTEEAKYDLDQTIFELYDTGKNVSEIASELAVQVNYIEALLADVPTENLKPD